MKKTILLAAMSMLFIVGLTSMVSMDPPPNSNCNEFCDVFGGFFDSHGDCISLCATCANPGQGGGVEAVCICNILDELFGLENIGIKNFGQCVKAVKGN